MNTAYLREIRSKTCYPAFRKFTDVVTILMFILAVVILIGGFVFGKAADIVIATIIALFIVLIAIIGKEVSLMLVDIADSTIEYAGRGSNEQGQPIAQSVARYSIPSETVASERVQEIKTAEAVSAKDRKRPENATLSNNMYCLYLTEKFEIKENETLRKFWVRGADDMFNSLNDALNAAHELEMQELGQANLEVEKRRVAMKEQNDIHAMQPKECIDILKVLGFVVSEGAEGNTWEIQKPSGIRVNIRSITALHEMTLIYMRRANKKT